MDGGEAGYSQASVFISSLLLFSFQPLSPPFSFTAAMAGVSLHFFCFPLFSSVAPPYSNLLCPVLMGEWVGCSAQADRLFYLEEIKDKETGRIPSKPLTLFVVNVCSSLFACLLALSVS